MVNFHANSGGEHATIPVRLRAILTSRLRGPLLEGAVD